jgi:hypothetical protein
MSIDKIGRRPAILAVTRASFVTVALMLGAALSACTTAEGTNALVDAGTFEREVMTSTLQGVGMVPKDTKPDPTTRRGPLVLPKQTAVLPSPTTENVAQLPVDSNNVQINTAGLSDADLKRLRNARVVDLRTLDGRPLTAVESKKLTARMNAAQMASIGQTKRPIYLPPQSYFTTVGGKDMVCLAASGDLVPLNDKACPPEIRKALQSQRRGAAPTAGAIGTDPNANFSNELGLGTTPIAQ